MKGKPAIFLDRDGVLNKESGYVRRLEQLEIYPYAKECVEFFHDLGYYVFVISNQSGVARGYLTEHTLKDIHSYLQKETGVDQIYYCPHYMGGIIKKYSIECDCRKPKTGLIGQACKDYLIDLGKSVMVGDRASDILLGINAGIKTVFLTSGYGNGVLETEVEPDYIVSDLRDVISICRGLK